MFYTLCKYNIKIGLASSLKYREVVCEHLFVGKNIYFPTKSRTLLLRCSSLPQEKSEKPVDGKLQIEYLNLFQKLTANFIGKFISPARHLRTKINTKTEQTNYSTTLNNQQQ